MKIPPLLNRKPVITIPNESSLREEATFDVPTHQTAVYMCEIMHTRYVYHATRIIMKPFKDPVYIMAFDRVLSDCIDF